ncbi:MAG: hypothetical protein ACOYJK_11210 [Prevotella sp.]|jgi:hypothetical protein
MKKEDTLKNEIPLVIARLMLLKQRKQDVLMGSTRVKIKSLSYMGVSLDKQDIPLNLDLTCSKDVNRFLEGIHFPSYNASRRWNIEINGKRYQIRCLTKNSRPLINHTNRAKFIQICHRANVSIEILDDMVRKYWQLRTSGIIREDIHMNDENCPFRKHRKDMEKLFGWIAFNSMTNVSGVEKGDNKCDYILDYLDPVDESTWTIFSKSNFAKVVYDYLVFSLRDNKGMPKGYSPESDNYDKAIKPWVRYRNNKYKGALHIRIKSLNTQDNQTKYFINKYREQITTLKNNNNGERDEILLKLYLLRCRMENKQIVLNGSPVYIWQLGNTPDENYQDFPNDIYSEIPLQDAKESPSLLFALCQSAKVEKAPSGYKADVFINQIGISVKSTSGAAPSIINTTSRLGVINVLSLINGVDDVCIEPMDYMVEKYWKKRLSGIITEDTRVSDNQCPFLSYGKDIDSRSYLKPIVNYFCFDGTGKGFSPQRAEVILVCSDPTDENTWDFFDKTNYFDFIWLKLIFSIRSQRYGKALNQPENQPWVRKLSKDGKEKTYGLLNLRVGK